MPRVAPAGRADEIGEAALKVFSEMGFRRAQVSDIAREAGIAQGTIYLYVASKESLFGLALQRSLGLPASFEMPPDILDQVAEKLPVAISTPSLGAVEGSKIEPIGLVIAELFDAISANAPAIRLIERCAPDWPELANLFYEGLRQQLLRRLTTYFELGAEQGVLRRTPDSTIAARLIVETIAWFTLHRAGDYDGRHYDDTAVRQVVVDSLTHAFQISPHDVRANQMENTL